MARFVPTVAGLRRAPAADGHADLTFDGLALLGTQSCTNYYGEAVSCPGPDSAVHTFSVALAGLPGAADYYAVSVIIDGPLLGGADCIVQYAPTAPGPCTTAGVSSYDGVVAPGAWVIRVPGDPGYLAVPSTFSADGTAANPSHTWWPDDSHHGILVNAAPSLPVPIAENYYPMALFTPGQLPASIDVQITHTNYEQLTLGSMHVGVLAYDETDEDPADAGRVMYVGAA